MSCLNKKALKELSVIFELTITLCRKKLFGFFYGNLHQFFLPYNYPRKIERKGLKIESDPGIEPMASKTRGDHVTNCATFSSRNVWGNECSIDNL